jgi:hypothetical protein
MKRMRTVAIIGLSGCLLVFYIAWIALSNSDLQSIPNSTPQLGIMVRATNTLQNFEQMGTAARLDTFETVATVIKQRGIDLNCTPPCWSNLRPGVTSMMEVFSLINRDQQFTVRGSNGDTQAAHNIFGADYAGFKIFALSDSSQPNPKLRAMVYRIPIDATHSIQKPPVNTDRWLPQNVIERHNPTSIVLSSEVIDKLGGTFELVLDFGNWAITYLGPLTQMTNSESYIPCVKTARRANIWVYSEAEGSVLNLLADLKNYPNSEAYYRLIFDINAYVQYTQPQAIMAILDQLRQTQCIDPKTLSRGE